MSISQFCLNWDSYEKNICNGFSRLQQREEFVDMTLAAEGHLVKVHQNMIALASPYLKELLCSAPCQHPVIFLNSISHEVLCFILEYIYTGEVYIPTDKLHSFIEAAKALHLTGMENMIPPVPLIVIRKMVQILKEPGATPLMEFQIPDLNTNTFDQEPVITNNSELQNSRPSNVAASITINDHNYNLEVQKFDSNIEEGNSSIIEANNDIEQRPEISGLFKSFGLPNANININTTNSETYAPKVLGYPNETIPYYSKSIRNSLQLILNRYIYYAHHSACYGRKRRWRCVDYRKLHCPAFVDTDDNIIVNRKHIHTHPFHDNKIIKKAKSNLLFSTLKEVTEKVSQNQDLSDNAMEET